MASTERFICKKETSEKYRVSEKEGSTESEQINHPICLFDDGLAELMTYDLDEDFFIMSKLYLQLKEKIMLLYGCDLLWDKDMPEAGPLKGRMYLKKIGDKLEYTVITPCGDRVVDFLDIVLDDSEESSLRERGDDILIEASRRGHIIDINSCISVIEREILNLLMTQLLRVLDHLINRAFFEFEPWLIKNRIVIEEHLSKMKRQINATGLAERYKNIMHLPDFYSGSSGSSWLYTILSFIALPGCDIAIRAAYISRKEDVIYYSGYKNEDSYDVFSVFARERKEEQELIMNDVRILLEWIDNDIKFSEDLLALEKEIEAVHGKRLISLKLELESIKKEDPDLFEEYALEEELERVKEEIEKTQNRNKVSDEDDELMMLLGGDSFLHDTPKKEEASKICLSQNPNSFQFHRKDKTDEFSKRDTKGFKKE